MCSENMGLLDPKSDYIFKLIFGKEVNKNVLLELINACMRGKVVFVDLQLTNTEISKVLEENRFMRLDVRAKTKDNQWIIVEMQSRNTKDLIERDVQYQAATLVENFKIVDDNGNKVPEEERNYLYPKVVSIWFVNENFTNRVGYIHDSYRVFIATDLDPYEVSTDKEHSIFIELPKFNEELRDKDDTLQSFLTFLKDPLNRDIQSSKILQQAYDTLKQVSADEKVREIYRLRQETDASIISERNLYALEARKEGERLAKIESARKMLKKGFDISDIAEISGLSIEEIQNLK